MHKCTVEVELIIKNMEKETTLFIEQLNKCKKNDRKRIISYVQKRC